MNLQKAPVLVVGEEKTSFSIAVCLMQAHHRVTLYTRNEKEALRVINVHLSDLVRESGKIVNLDRLNIVTRLETPMDSHLAIITNSEDIEVKREVIRELEAVLPEQALITVNTESIPLSSIQDGATVPERIIGANWVEPVHTTFFLEIISNERIQKGMVDGFFSVARSNWQKDPYVLYNDRGIRSRMMSAMVREAFYLIENDYVSIEDIDRACRNDPGYYLPFAGHCRYMDLMGAYVYGVVMKDLNPELSKSTHIPAFFSKLVKEGAEGIKNYKGFYAYEPEEAEKRMAEFRKFSFEIREIISKYPFNELRESGTAKKKAVSNL